jgi:hypothetical protein
MSPLLSAAPSHETPATGTPLVLASHGIADQLPLGGGAPLPYGSGAAEQVIGHALEDRQAPCHSDSVSRPCHVRSPLLLPVERPRSDVFETLPEKHRLADKRGESGA